MKLYGSLDNYIEMHRQRAGLSQAELAFLIGVEKAASVSRYEQSLRLPSAEVLLALEFVFSQPIQELYAGVAERVQGSVTSRARTLLENLDDTPSPELVLKLELLSKLARPDDVSIIPLWEEKE